MSVQSLNLHGNSRDEVIQNFNMRVFRNFADLSIFRRGFDHDFKTVSLSFLVTFVTDPSFHTYLNKPAHKNNASDIEN